MSTSQQQGTRIHPRFLELGSLLLIAPLCVVGAIIGVQLIVTLGITANTSLIGALAGMALARIPLRAFIRYRSVHVQNLAQSAISAATFGAGNALMLPIGIPFVLGRPDLVPALFAGVFLAMLLDGYRCIACSIPTCSRQPPPGHQVPLRPRQSAPATRAVAKRSYSVSASWLASRATG